MAKICMFTGHRDINREHLSSLADWLEQTVEALIASGVTEFCAGGALGFDMFAALKVIEKKQKYGFVKLHLFLPCKNQNAFWHENHKTAYAYVLKNADSISYASEKYTTGCMHKRNRDMVNTADVCVAYCAKHSGGTYYTVCAAQKKGLQIINFF